MRILGISCYYHDAAAAILVDDVLVTAAEEERFSRVKHDNKFPSNAIGFCLSRAGLMPQDLDYVVFYEKPVTKFGRILTTAFSTFPSGWRVFCEALISWSKGKLWIKDVIRERLDIPASRLLFVDHLTSHGASAFLCSPYEQAVVITADGVGEWTTASIGHGVADWDGLECQAVGQKEYPGSGYQRQEKARRILKARHPNSRIIE